MKERPILFSAPMVRAILDGNKTQTRRIVKPQPIPNNRGQFKFESASDDEGIETYWHNGMFWKSRCPYGQPGDQLWVRENCKGWKFDISGENVVRYAANGAFEQIENSVRGADRWIDLYNYAGKRGATVPSIHMPRWASRIQLEITGVRVERLQDISDADAKAESAQPYLLPCHPARESLRHVDGFNQLWESINGIGSWDANPWVWVVEFKVIKP